MAVDAAGGTAADMLTSGSGEVTGRCSWEDAEGLGTLDDHDCSMSGRVLICIPAVSITLDRSAFSAGSPLIDKRDLCFRLQQSLPIVLNGNHVTPDASRRHGTSRQLVRNRAKVILPIQRSPPQTSPQSVSSLCLLALFSTLMGSDADGWLIIVPFAPLDGISTLSAYHVSRTFLPHSAAIRIEDTLNFQFSQTQPHPAHVPRSLLARLTRFNTISPHVSHIRSPLPSTARLG